MFYKGKNNFKLALKFLLPFYFLCIIIWYIFFRDMISFSLGNGISWIFSVIIFFNIIIIFDLKFYGGGISFDENMESRSSTKIEKIIFFIISIIGITLFLWKISTSLLFDKV